MNPCHSFRSKNILLPAVWIFLLNVSNGLAAPAYGPHLPKRNQVHSGLQTYAVFNRYLEKEQGEMRSVQHFVLLSYGLTDWLSLDLKGGAGYVKQHPGNADERDYPTFMAGGYGFRLKLYDQGRAKGILGFQHISVHPYSIEVNNIKNKAVLDDWQWSMLISYDVSDWQPYLGVRWSRMDYIHWIEDQRDLKKSDGTKSAGLILGTNIFFAERLWINLEAQLLDSEAAAFSLNYRF